MKGLSGLIMTLIGFSSPTVVNAENVSKSIHVSGKASVSLEVQAPEYFRGNISSNTALKNITLSGPGDDITKQILRTGEKETEIFWLVTKSGKYIFDITTPGAKTAKVSIQLHSLPLKKNQYVSPEQTIISPLLKETTQKIQQGLPQAEEHFWNAIEAKGTPLIEKDQQQKNTVLMTFLYRGNAKNVRVLGAPYDGHAHLSKIPGSRIWFKSYRIPDTSRFSYRIAPDVPQIAEKNWAEQRRAVLATTQPDPLNHLPRFSQNDNLFGAASTVTLPKAPDDHYTQNLNHPRGQVTEYHYQSQALNNTRKISLYRPNNRYPVSESSPLLILFDGDDYLSKVPTPLILDNLIAEKKIPPMRAVFINTPSPSMRSRELPPNRAFSDFMANEFKPWLCQKFSVCPTAGNTILSGSSYGGLASMYIAFRHPESFGKVLSQSGSFWWSPEAKQKNGTKPHNWIAEQVASSAKQPVDVYLNAGLFETKPDFANILETNRTLYNTLKNKGYKVHFTEIAGGHDYFSWRVMLSDGLIKLFQSNSHL
ncbi:enterochelin esterase [Vibrio salinus]|uniref:enterochelin esterase n=1 Tax=Vibrio salinus TaxID=2899784 RepID=UPI001E39F779|nr:enterochelin esterase [Vibrio salinus]MCE0493547.1 enterochelin esterase [Vibrio salinus]